jgi:hypothetical protein
MKLESAKTFLSLAFRLNFALLRAGAAGVLAFVFFFVTTASALDVQPRLASPSCEVAETLLERTSFPDTNEPESSDTRSPIEGPEEECIHGFGFHLAAFPTIVGTAHLRDLLLPGVSLRSPCPPPRMIRSA